MSARLSMRALAYAIAVVAMIDPSIRVESKAPVGVDLRGSDGRLVSSIGATGSEGVQQVRDRLEASLSGDVAFNGSADAAEVVFVGDRISAEAVPSNGPASIVMLAEQSGPNVWIAAVSEPERVLAGWVAPVSVTVHARGMAGKSTALVMTHGAIEVDRLEHKWTRDDEEFDARLTYTPPMAGVHTLKVRAVPLDIEANRDDNAVAVRIDAESRVLKVVSYDARPAWAAAFVRHALETDPAFDVTSLVRTSRGLEVRAGEAPATLTSQSLDPFDVVIVGAPEELTSGETAALAEFARRRGGAVVLLADTRPSGAYTSLIGSPGFEELLLERPVRLETGGPQVAASELAIPRVLPRGATPLASLPQGPSRAAIVAAPLGLGQVIFSGVLDAWRSRARDDDAFATFWRQQIARAAVRAPRRLEVTVQPGIAVPGDEILIRATLRPTELVSRGEEVAVPAVSAQLVDTRVESRRDDAMIRLWPSAEPGRYEGRLRAPSEGRYVVRVSTESGTIAEAPLVASDDQWAVPDAQDAAALVARATGGVAVTAKNLDSLIDHLRGLPRVATERSAHPMRSAWSAIAFVSLLSGEWMLRRARGHR
jgi:hypothetical protein